MEYSILLPCAEKLHTSYSIKAQPEEALRLSACHRCPAQFSLGFPSLSGSESAVTTHVGPSSWTIFRRRMPRVFGSKSAKLPSSGKNVKIYD
jgi:hypothetical protein